MSFMAELYWNPWIVISLFLLLMWCVQILVWLLVKDELISLRKELKK
jgi:hypothetical protein